MQTRLNVSQGDKAFAWEQYRAIAKNQLAAMILAADRYPDWPLNFSWVDLIECPINLTSRFQQGRIHNHRYATCVRR